MPIICNDCKIPRYKYLNEVGYPTSETGEEYAVTIGNMTFIVSNSPGLMLSYEQNKLSISTRNTVNIPPNTAAEIDMQTYIRIPKGIVMKYNSVYYPLEPNRDGYTVIVPERNYQLSTVHVLGDYMDDEDDDIYEADTGTYIIVKGDLELFAPSTMCYPRWFATNLQEFGQFRYIDHLTGHVTGDDNKIFIDSTMSRYVTIKSDPIVSFQIRKGVIECKASRQAYVSGTKEVTLETDFTINVPSGISASYNHIRRIGDTPRYNDCISIPTDVDYKISLTFTITGDNYKTTVFNDVNIMVV